MRKLLVLLLLVYGINSTGYSNDLTELDLTKLSTCHKKLQLFVTEVAKVYPIKVMDCHRNKNEQNKAFYRGKSLLRFPKSKHNSYPSMAVDIIPLQEGKYTFRQLSKIAKRIAKELNINVQWGGDWHGFIDMPHWELIEQDW